MSVEHVRAHPGGYADSVTLMSVSAQAQAVPGVRAALVAMATELNLDLLAGLGMAAPAGTGPNDLLVAVRADDADALAAALAVIDEAIAGRPGGPGGGPGGGPLGGAAAGVADQAATSPPPRTTASAIRRTGPGLALISVPGQHAYAEALDALLAGSDVMIFSDNVPVEQEIALKDLAAERGLLVMGPDCGTAIVGGVGLGFSHRVPAGPVGVVAASGTGAQQVVCLLDAAGVGVSAVLGLGGRDLSAAVGGRSARTALAALDADPATKLILVVSKLPDPAVAAGLAEHAATLGTEVRFALIGSGQPDLTEAVETALRALGRPVPDWPSWPAAGGGHAGGGYAAGGGHAGGEPESGTGPAGSGVLRGLFAGGTLCEEAMAIAAGRLGAVYSNVPLRPEWLIDPLAPAGQAGRHTMIDFGDDALTVGRPHPMIDQRIRLDRLAAEAADPSTAVILLDVVLGHGAHPDPAAELAPAIAAALAGRASGGPGGSGGESGQRLSIVASLIGAASDPQDPARQAAALAAAGAHVFASNAQAARFACDLAGADSTGVGRTSTNSAGTETKGARP